MSKLAIGALVAFSLATCAFVGVSFGSDINALPNNPDSITEDLEDDVAAADDGSTPERSTRRKTPKIRKESQLAAPEPDELADMEEPPAKLALPTNLPKLTNHLPTRPDDGSVATMRPTGPDAVAMAMAERTMTVMIGHLERLEAADTAEEGHRELLKMQRTMQRFAVKWRPLQSTLTPATRRKLEAYARERGGDIPGRISAAMERFAPNPTGAMNIVE